MIASSLRQALSIQTRVVGALLMREIITRYGRRNIGFLWLFIEPMLFTLGVTVIWSLWREKGGPGFPIIPFAITGYSCVLLWRNASNRAAKAIVPNLSLLYHRQVTVLDLFLARVLLEIAGATMSLVVMLSLFIFLGLADIPADPLTMAWAWLLLSWFTLSLGLIVGALSERSETFDRVWHTVTYLLFPLSGAMFMVDWFPPPIRDWLLLIPMVHATEMIRGGYFGDLFTTHYSVSYLALVSFVMFWLGLLLIERGKHLVMPE